MTANPRDWYVLHVKPRTEKKVMQYLALGRGFRHLPVYIKVTKVQRRKVRRELPIFPGYVFVHMIMNEDNWYLVRNTRGVTGFVGSEPTRPVPLTEEEMMNLGVQAPAVQPGFEIGDSVRVINSAWVNNPVGVIREIDVSKQTVKISIPEFMNGTPVSMDFTDIAKI